MSDRALGAACVVASVAMAAVARNYTAAFSYEPLGPRAFPLLLAVGLGLSGLWLVLRPTLGAQTFNGVPWMPTLWCAGAIMAYAALFQAVGFVLATALMTVPVGMAFGGTWRKTLAGGAALGLVLFLLFDKVLDVVLPVGPLAAWLGGF
ncbi:tripartite tricarboxylate transporter TctB family protein [Hydrogenophaga sp. 2FB]|uniref:tripartite tricarboxylate transporter TctB family protein n=1 Tax=Hydrogenophaga sp. 2FB TaxID=2502187 RepID=UPI0010F4419F|nr:tripartite tricarboxylate transporter TctB family protein [Hydrogenophaga sp. 2FB]